MLRRIVSYGLRLFSSRRDEESIRKELRRLSRRVDKLIELNDGQRKTNFRELSRGVERIVSEIPLERKWRMRTKDQINALLRHSYTEEMSISSPLNTLMAKRFRLFSQNEEDGISLYLLSQIGVESRKFVELGSGASGGNSGLFASEFGWKGVMVDSNPTALEKCHTRYADPGRVACHCMWVDTENVNDIIRDNGLSGEVDIFSLDIDSYDYWIFEAMNACSPRICILEYNSWFGPDAAVTVPKGADLNDTPKEYFGASLTALTKLAAAKGYRLVGCEPSGVNAFFVRKDLWNDPYEVTPSEAFRRMRDRREASDYVYRDRRDVIEEFRAKGLALEEV